jgi:hypothetical protein
MLRVGVWLDSYNPQAWVAKVIEDIQSSGFARVELVILNASPNSTSLSEAHRNSWGFGLFRRFEQWDYQRNRYEPDALGSTDVASLLEEVPSIPVDDLAEVLKHNLDVIFDFGLCPVHGDMLSAARYGVWSFQYDENPPFFWDIYDRNPVSRSSLRTLANPPETSRIIYESKASTDFTSLYRSRNPIYWKTSEFAVRALRNLHSHGDTYIQSLPADRDGDSPTRNPKRSPNPLRLAVFMARHLSRSVQARRASLRSGPRKKWCLVVRRRSANYRFDDPTGYHLIPSPKDRFYADPMLVERDGKTFLFFEDFRFAEGRAVISCCELSPDGTAASQPAEVLRRPFHLSYPFIFEHEGEMYMVPETKGNCKVELYRATSFPHTWESEAVLLDDIYAVDATIHKANGKFWMFASVSDGRYSNCDELSLFFADSLKGPWTPHPRNPLISDVERARPAGALFYEEGHLIRPSQDSSKAYGYALVFSEVLTLTETEYEERLVSRLDPESVPGNIANHTYNRTEHFEVIDRDLSIKML